MLHYRLLFGTAGRDEFILPPNLSVADRAALKNLNRRARTASGPLVISEVDLFKIVPLCDEAALIRNIQKIAADGDYM